MERIGVQHLRNIVDLGKQTVLPGLIDCHDHIAGSPGDGGDTQMLRETDAHQALWGALHAKITLDAGFTTIRNVGSGSYAEVALKGFINHGATAGTARPTGFTSVEWVGSVEPTNAVNGDTWIDTS